MWLIQQGQRTYVHVSHRTQTYLYACILLSVQLLATYTMLRFWSSVIKLWALNPSRPSPYSSNECYVRAILHQLLVGTRPVAQGQHHQCSWSGFNQTTFRPQILYHLIYQNKYTRYLLSFLLLSPSHSSHHIYIDKHANPRCMCKETTTGSSGPFLLTRNTHNNTSTRNTTRTRNTTHTRSATHKHDFTIPHTAQLTPFHLHGWHRTYERDLRALVSHLHSIVRLHLSSNVSLQYY